MAVTFARWLGGPDDVPAQMFTVRNESARAGLGCTVCGERFELPRGCGVDQVGRTSVAVHCTRATCSFWSFAVLESIWEPA
jgi:hypothetical protein